MDDRSAGEMLLPLLAAGSGRSGTTLMMQLLGTSSRIVSDDVYAFECSYLAYLLPVAETVQLGSKRQEGRDRGTLMHRGDVKDGIISFSCALVPRGEIPHWLPERAAEGHRHEDQRPSGYERVHGRTSDCGNHMTSDGPVRSVGRCKRNMAEEVKAISAETLDGLLPDLDYEPTIEVA